MLNCVSPFFYTEGVSMYTHTDIIFLEKGQQAPQDPGAVAPEKMVDYGQWFCVDYQNNFCMDYFNEGD